MPNQTRHLILEFSGDDLTSGTSPEVDASSFTDAILHCSRGSGVVTNIHLEAAPEEFSEAATWHHAYTTPSGSTNMFKVATPMRFEWGIFDPNDVVISFPYDTDSSGYIDTRVPRRFRIVKDQNLTGLAVELRKRVS